MERERNKPTAEEILAPYQLSTRLQKYAKPDALVMHCLPAHRGEEISAEVLDGPRSSCSIGRRTGAHAKAILVDLGKKSRASSKEVV